MKGTLLLMALILTTGSICAQSLKDTLFVNEPVTPLLINRVNNLYSNLSITPVSAEQTLNEIELKIQMLNI